MVEIRSLFQALGSWGQAKKRASERNNEEGLALVLPRFFSRSFSLVPNYREPSYRELGTG